MLKYVQNMLDDKICLFCHEREPGTFLEKQKNLICAKRTSVWWYTSQDFSKRVAAWRIRDTSLRRRASFLSLNLHWHAREKRRFKTHPRRGSQFMRAFRSRRVVSVINFSRRTDATLLAQYYLRRCGSLTWDTTTTTTSSSSSSSSSFGSSSIRFRYTRAWCFLFPSFSFFLFFRWVGCRRNDALFSFCNPPRCPLATEKLYTGARARRNSASLERGRRVI